MTEPAEITAPASGPQRSGKGLFFLWVAGLLVQAVVMRVLMVAAAPAMANSAHTGVVLFAALAVAGHAWQAWLLFRPGWRFALWAALPLMMLIMPGNYRWIQMQGIIAPLFELIALAGIRQRPWAWLLAGMGQVILSGLSTPVIYGAVQGMVSRMAPSTFVAGLVVSGIQSGVWLSGEIAAAVALAWWMPPIRQAK